MEKLDFITIKSTKCIIEECVKEVLVQVESFYFTSAGMILNLIHNLPLNEESEKKWSIDYFLSMELTTFLENYEQIHSSRKIVFCVCKHLERQGYALRADEKHTTIQGTH